MFCLFLYALFFQMIYVTWSAKRGEKYTIISDSRIGEQITDS